MVKAPKARRGIQHERTRISQLLHTYGSLLTQRQLALAQQFCLEGKNFSEIARDRQITRQAVHEAIRSVQQQLELFEMKLGLVERGGHLQNAEISNLTDRIRDLRQRVAVGEFERSSLETLLQEFDKILQFAESAPNPIPGPRGSALANPDPHPSQE